MPNRLASEASPYLRQHADNPVDWYPWGEAAFAAARGTDRPILLSIGYAACHWCHVMAHESFEDAATAAVMNRLFVNVKVDREERPDVDAIYMQAVQAMTGRGGWPMTVFLTPDGEPFYGGTYFPPADIQGIPSFTRLMQSVASAWTTRREAVTATATTLRDLYANASAPLTPSGRVTAALLHDAAAATLAQHDAEAQGFGTAPKFPQAMALDFLLRHGTRHAHDGALGVVTDTWLAMTQGGIFDQLGGGFARYAIDRAWVVPHFEKMLYDNALLARLGVHLAQSTGSAEIERATRDVIGWVMREMTAGDGSLYASIDADSEGEEGRYYTFTRDELRALLGDDAPLAELAFGVTAGGNFEGKSILVQAMSLEFVAARLAMPLDEVSARMVRVRQRLLQARARRVPPATDRKRVAAWNGLMLAALAEAARVFGDPGILRAATRLAAFLTTTMCNGDRVGRSWIEGSRLTPGYLDDQAAVIAGLLALYTCTGSLDALQHARRLAVAMVRDFHDPQARSFYDTARDHEALITRPRELTDNATPCGAALACDVLLQLATLDDMPEYRAIVGQHLEAVAATMADHPLGFGHWLGVADRWVHGGVEVALVSGPDGDDDFLATVNRAYVPALTLARSGAGAATDPAVPALLRGRTTAAGRTTAWVCRGHTCELPATDTRTLAQQLRAAVRFQGG
ncbi:MAG: thioredoxin domain-containing protein [Gemmatimonadaceae bacterium]|nr:thioredoxin domain-containing protein [Gemmatimonadaceae bacterium]